VKHGIWPLVGAASMRALDRHSIDVLGVSGELLMECAGRAVAEVVLAKR
jgi:NAD(P)H-hydrate repair Nnr-like enzyme with NAD(P)H-hydrate epimerase domain